MSDREDERPSEGDTVMIDGERHRVEKTDADGRIISVRRMDGDVEISRPRSLWLWERVMVGFGAMTALWFAGFMAWGMWLVHIRGRPFTDPDAREFVQDPIGVMAEPLMTALTESVLWAAPLSFAVALALGTVIMAAVERFQSHRGDSDV